MLGPRFALGCLGCLAVALATPWACIPHPDGDFEDYQTRVAAYPKQEGGSTFEAGPPPKEAVEGLYYGACLSELGFGQPSKVFNFYTKTKFTPNDSGGGTLSLSIQPLKVENLKPPPTISLAGAVGAAIQAPDATVEAVTSKFSIALGTVTVPGTANPISGSDVLIELGTLRGFYGTDQMCARLGGNVIKPEAAARTLADGQNICQFVPIKDGDTTPELGSDKFQPGSCTP